jgi:hypothetical protein
MLEETALPGTDFERERAFNKAFRELDARVKIFTSLRFDMLDDLSLKQRLNEDWKDRRRPGIKRLGNRPYCCSVTRSNGRL